MTEDTKPQGSELVQVVWENSLSCCTNHSVPGHFLPVV
uniref:Uncharacterized protein n=1 Tax=Anguilla anguilla TaxID=7936 RepID=A0A0E9UFL1_ANGAN